jgi:hypothetical protein
VFSSGVDSCENRESDDDQDRNSYKDDKGFVAYIIYSLRSNHAKLLDGIRDSALS